eukprot:c10993_g1_i1.p1 GENE.c10993_g1_i1~~c10993_g1_i1.p1  ORF type:complete len:362 (-),score=58.36 c10993_g1_i1:117-1202(-)
MAAHAAEPWGLCDGESVSLLTIELAGLIKATVSTFGATLVSLETLDRAGKMGPVITSLPSVEAIRKSRYMGVSVGRVANRIANGRFELEGALYSLPVNNNNLHCLHGGTRGFSSRVWRLDSVSRTAVTLSIASADGDQGFPGDLTAAVTYSLEHTPASASAAAESTLRIVYTAAVTGKASPVSLTNHAFFNLAGPPFDAVYDHTIAIYADSYVPVDSTLAPLGHLAPVADSAFDLRGEGARIGDRIELIPGGFDHNFALATEPLRPLTLAATVREPTSGRVMRVATTQPGLQFYSGNFLDGSLVGVNGDHYSKHSAFCLETQAFPDAVNQPAFPSCIVAPDEEYRHETKYSFSIAPASADA